MNPSTMSSAMPVAYAAAGTTAARPGDPTRQLERIDALVAENGSIELAPFDLHCLMRRCLGDAPFCGAILHKFAARAGDQLAALERALASRNLVELADRAHALKGVAFNLSAASLAESAAVLENATRRGDSSLESLVSNVRQELVRCLQAVPQTLLALQSQS